MRRVPTRNPRTGALDYELVAQDAAQDVAQDAGRSAVGLWRITRVQVLGTTTNDTGSTRINGLVDIRSASIGVSYTNVTNDRVRLAHSGLLTCASPRALDATARGAVGLLDDARNLFTITEGAAPPTFTFNWVNDEQLQATYHNVVDIRFTLARLAPVTPRRTYAASFQIWFEDDLCRGAPAASVQHKTVLLWERADGGNAIPAAPPSSFTRMTNGLSVTALTPALSLTGAPPVEAIGNADGVQAAIAYVVVFDDTNNNNTLDHAVTGGSGDTLLGISNVAIAWRGGPTPHTGAERSSFIDTFEGYQTVVIGQDSRSDGGSAPWLVDGSTNALHVGCFAEDPTRPFIAGGLVQTRAEPGPLPRLLR